MDEQPKKKRMGRPPGKNYEKARNIQVSDEDEEAISKLATHWRCSGAAAIRRAVHEAVKREKLP